MKRKEKKIINNIIYVLILLIPSFIEKFCFPNEPISFTRFIFLQCLAILLVAYLSKNFIHFFSSLLKRL